MVEKLTRKQEGFVKDYVATDNATQAALNNYDTDKESVAASIGYENLRKPEIVKAIADLIPDDLLREKHLALLNKIDAEGEIDVQAVKAGLDMGYKIKGTYAPEKKDVQLTGTIENTIGAEIAKKYEEELKGTL